MPILLLSGISWIMLSLSWWGFVALVGLYLEAGMLVQDRPCSGVSLNLIGRMVTGLSLLNLAETEVQT